ncbi:MAG: zf-HC2 domain-containing protein [Clostridiales bacterium]|nr:zf-HC2 domain-containing protein [Clostridiales bacterium]
MNNCEIIGDLLPLYKDEAASTASIELVETHLQECESCRDALAALQGDIALSAEESVPDAAPLRKIRKKLRVQKLLIALASVLLAAIITTGVVLGIRYKLYESETAIPYSEDLFDYEAILEDGEVERMPYSSAHVPADTFAEFTNFPKESNWKITVGREEDEDDEPLLLILSELSPILRTKSGCYRVLTSNRVVERDGVQVHVNYICLTETIMSRKKDAACLAISFLPHMTRLEEMRQPWRMEWYYLNDGLELLRDPDTLQAMSDADYDALRTGGVCIYSGQLYYSPKGPLTITGSSLPTG